MKAPLEGDRIAGTALLPDFLAPAGQQFFKAKRWRVDIYVDAFDAMNGAMSVLVKTHEWISALTAEAAIEHVRAYGYTDAVRYEATEVRES